MKIAEISAIFPPFSGGTGFVCLHNARSLIRHGHDVTVITVDFGTAAYDQDPTDVKIIRLHSPLIIGRGAFVPRLLGLVRSFDVVHLHYPFFGGAEYIWLASVLYGIPYAVTYHNDVFGESGPRKFLISLYERLFLRRILRRAEAVFGLSLVHLKSTKAAPLLDWSKVQELPNGVDMNIFSPRAKDAALVEKYALKDKTVILFIGHLIPLKGLRVLISALALIRDKSFILLVIGEGHELETDKKLVREMDLQDRILFLGGSIPHDTELPRYFDTCDFLVLPSTESEAFPLVVIEAMASAKPVIVSALPGPSGLVNDGVTGLIANVGDSLDLKNKIHQLLEAPDRCRSMGRAAHQKVYSLFRADIVGDQLEASLVRIRSSMQR